MARPTSDNIYPYNPVLGAAIAFSVLNSIWALWHFYLALWLPRSKTSKHRYTIPLVVAAWLSTVGYSVRIASVGATGSIPLYAASSSYIVIAPIFVCATLYLLLTHLVRLSLPTGPQQALFGIPPRWLGMIFVSSDGFSFLTQCAGSGIASSGNWKGNLKEIGLWVLLAGLGLQLATFTTYLIFTWRFMCRVRSVVETGFDPCVTRVLIGIWVAGAFVQIRTLFRLIEFALGIDSYPFQNEWCLYVLEAVPMFIALGVLAWYHPVKWLQQQSRFEVAMDDSTERDKGPTIRARRVGNV